MRMGNHGFCAYIGCNDLVLDPKVIEYGTNPTMFLTFGEGYDGDGGDNGYLAKQAELNAGALIDRTRDWSNRSDNPNWTN